MELLIKAGEAPETFIITEVIDSTDVLGNPIKIAGQEGQHTVESVTNNIASLLNQKSEIDVQIDKWNEYLQKINEYVTIH